MLIAVLAMSAVLVACGSGNGSKADRQEVADFATRMAGISGTGDQADIDFYLAHVTDNFVRLFGSESVEVCAANAAECIGDPLTNPRVDPDTVKIDGDSATLTLVSDETSFKAQATREGNEWKLDGLAATSDELPEGVQKVDLTLSEFSFAFDKTDEHLVSGNFAFHVKNAGKQTHEVALFKLPAEGDLMQLLQSDDPETAGLEFITFKFPFQPGDEADMAIPELSAGRYALVCFQPDTNSPEGTPHAFEGMTAEFSVQ